QVTSGGVPVADADVSVWTATGNATDVQADANGDYTAVFAPGSYTLIVDGAGFARNYSTATFAAGPQATNVALTAESAVSASVSLSDGQAVQSVNVLGVLHGDQPFPDFSGHFNTSDFQLGSLDPGVYDFTISVPGYYEASIPDVLIAQGQTVDLGAFQLTPVDLVASATDVAERNDSYNYFFGSFPGMFADGLVGPDATKIVKEYFEGPGVPVPFQMDTVPIQSYTYSPSAAPNPPVIVTDVTDPATTAAFATNPVTKNALQKTLAQIIKGGFAGSTGLEGLPEVQKWLAPYFANGTIPGKLTLDVKQTMTELLLDDWQTVSKFS